MTLVRIARIGLVLLAALAVIAPARARAAGAGLAGGTVLYDTLSQAPDYGLILRTSEGAGFSFQTTATDYVVDTVKVILQLPAGAAAATSGNVTVALFDSDASDGSGLPGNALGAAIGTIPVGDLTTIRQTFTFSGLARTLSPSTGYWITLTSTDISTGYAIISATTSPVGGVTTNSLGHAYYDNSEGDMTGVWNGPRTFAWILGSVTASAAGPTPTPVATATPTPPPGPTPTPGSSNLAACAITPSTIGLCPGATVPTSVTVSPDPATVDLCGSSNGVSAGCVTTSVAAGPFIPISYDNLVSQGLAEGDFYALSLSAPGSPSAKCSLSVTLLPPSDPSCGDLVDTDAIEEPFVQLNDRPVSKSQGPVDTFAIRGRVYFAQGEDPIGSALANGVTSTVYQTGSAGGSFVGYSQVDTFTWLGSQCKATKGGLSVYCKDPASGSSLRLRGTRAKPTSLRVNTVVRRRDFVPGKPFTVPLAGEVTITNASPSVGPANFDWDGFPEVTYCSISHNGERTTCRQPKAGAG